MGKRGPPPKPAALRLVQGNASRRPLPEDAPEPEVLEHAKAPEGLTDLAKTKWPEMVEVLSRNGVFTEMDIDRLALYCEAWADVERANEWLYGENGFIAKSPGGVERISPYFTVRDKAVSLMNLVMNEFGMGPASRTRIKVDAPKDNSKKTSKSRLLD